MGSFFAHVGTLGRSTVSASIEEHEAAEHRHAGREARPLPWRRITRDAVAIFLVTRVAYAIATYFAVAFAINSVRSTTTQPTRGALLLAWQTGDVRDYLDIAAHGYTYSWQTCFFPLYPLLIHLLSFGHATLGLVVAMLLSNLGTLAALIGLGLLAAHEFGAETSVPAIRALVAFPLAFFTVMAYADNIFLALVIFAFLCARRGAWGGAIACLFVSAFVRPTAVTLVLPLLWEYGRQQGWWAALWAVARRERTPARGLALLRASGWSRLVGYPVLLLAAVPGAVAIFAAYCWARFGDPLTFLQQQTHFQRQSVPLPSGLNILVSALAAWNPLSMLAARNLIDIAPFLVFAALVVLACARRQMSVAYLIYVLGVFYADLAVPRVGTTTPFGAMGRHMLLAVPVFLLLGKWSTRRPWLDMLIMSLGIVLQGALLVAVLHGSLIGSDSII